MRPTTLNILGKNYTVVYCDTPSDVDRSRRESLSGQIDYWTRTIRVFAKDVTEEDVLDTLLHEALHGIATELDMGDLKGDEHVIGLLAMALTDFLTRNGWLR